MEYSSVVLEMLERIQLLESKVKDLEEKINSISLSQPQAAAQLDKVSVRYRSLAEYLLSSNAKRINLSYEQIENILGFTLPNTARNFKKSYWANTKTHSYASSWMAVGYKARVDVETDIVTFIKNMDLSVDR